MPRALDDIDPINFAMGVRDFDVARHQPHPPGYPVFVALAKLATATARAAGAASPEVVGLAIWSALGGAILIVATFFFSRALFADDLHALIASVLCGAAPLVWFTALRPLSDVAGLAVAGVALACLAGALQRGDAWHGRRRTLLIAGACLAGLSIGFRSQMAVLTLPMLLYVIVAARPRLSLPAATAAAGAAALAGLSWGIPLVVVSGGLDAYLQALGSQAGEDFAGVVMLWTHRTPRVAAFALLNTFMLPWDSPILAGVMGSLAAGGLAWTLRRRFHSALVLVVVFGPYLAFHLLFQETLTVRYALPLVMPVAMLAAATLAQARTAAASAASAALVLAALAHAVPAGAWYATRPHPFTGALAEMRLIAARGAEPAIGMHRRIWSESRRARQWYGDLPGRLLQTPRDYEWLELARAWRDGHDSETWFLADPRRTDLALIDSEYRRTREYRWPLDAAVYLGGGRPDEIDWHVYQSPGWFLERGWALTAEVGGITERDGFGPHRQPSIGWIRRRPGPAVMMIGGRHLGSPGDPPMTITATIDDRPVVSFEASPGYFLRFVPVPASTLEGDGNYARLAVRAIGPGGGTAPPVGLEQFNLQNADRVQFGFGDGWMEPEYNPQTGRAWRWMSEKAALQLHHAGRDVTITIRGESPLRYYGAPPALRVVAGGETVAEIRPDQDFTLEASVPARLLEAAGGRVVLESSEFFVPGDRDGSPDRRRLALRIYAVTVTGR